MQSARNLIGNFRKASVQEGHSRDMNRHAANNPLFEQEAGDSMRSFSVENRPGPTRRRFSRLPSVPRWFHPGWTAKMDLTEHALLSMAFPGLVIAGNKDNPISSATWQNYDVWVSSLVNVETWGSNTCGIEASTSSYARAPTAFLDFLASPVCDGEVTQIDTKSQPNIVTVELQVADVVQSLLWFAKAYDSRTLESLAAFVSAGGVGAAEFEFECMDAEIQVNSRYAAGMQVKCLVCMYCRYWMDTDVKE